MLQSRKFTLDLAKFSAIFLVTGFHVWRFIGKPSAIWHGFDLWGIFKNGYMGCDLFFLISGYLSMQSWEKTEGMLFKDRLKKYYANKIIRIIPVYYIAIALWCILVNEGIAVKSYGMVDIITHMVFVHTFNEATFFSTSGVFWYLGVQVHFYLLFPLLVKIFEKFNRKIIFTLSFIPLILINIIMGKTENVVVYWNVVIFMPTFLCGILLYKKDMVFKQRTCLVPLALILIGIMFCREITLFVGAFDRVLAGIIMGILFINITVWIEKIPVIIQNTVSVVSMASFSIYLYNYIIYSWKPFVKYGTGLVLYIMLTFGFGIMMYHIIEKPVIELITNNKHSKRLLQTGKNYI